MPSSVASLAGGHANLSAAVEDLSSPKEPPPVESVQFGVAQALYAVLVELDADPDQFMAELGLDPQLFDGGSKLVPFVSVGRLIALAADRTRCPHLGLLVGKRTTLEDLGLIGLLMRHSETVCDAQRAAEAYVGVQNRGAAVGLGIHDDIAVLSYASHEAEGEGAAHHSDRALATATNILRALCGSGWAPLEVLLPRSAPRDTVPYRGFFRAPVRFGQEMAALVFPAKLLKQRIVGADSVVRRRVEDRIRRLEATQPSSQTDELSHYLRVQVTRQRCKAERVARLRLVSRRTLSRRLRAEGTTFKRLANEAQFRVAKQLLADTDINMAQISAVLDFSEHAAFTHAFRRWSGMPPTAWRQASRPETKHNQPHEGPRPCGRDIGCSDTFVPGPAPL